jgi:PAS domain S-box-containing protein
MLIGVITMNFLDTRTVLFSYIVSDAICAAVIASLWLQNRRRSAGLGFWLADFFLQFTAVLLIALHGLAPDFVSILLGSPLAIGGALLLYIGLERYTGRRSSQRHNYLLLAVFISVHAYFTFVRPSLQARNINFSLALLVICSQCAWLLLHRVSSELRPHTRLAGVIFGVYSLVNLARVFVDWAGPQGSDLFKSGLFDTLVILAYQMLFIGLTFGLFLMVNRRLVEDVDRLASFPKSNPNPVLAVGPDGTITFINAAVTNALNRIGAASDARAFLPADMGDILRKLAHGEQAKLHREVTLGGTIFAEDLYLLPQFATAHVYIHDITERKRAETSLKKSEERFSKAFQTSPDAIVISSITDENIIQVNGSFYRMAGLTPEEVVGKTTLELRLWESLAARDQFVAALQKTGRVLNFETTFRRKTGELFTGWISGELLELQEGRCVLTIIHDVTERKQAEEKLNASEARYRRLFEAAQDGILILDAETGLVLDANPFLMEILGFSLDEFRQKKLWELGFFQDIAANQAKFLELQQHEYSRYEDLPLETTDGRRINVEFISNVYLVNHHRVIQCNIRDITDRKRAEEALQAYSEQLEEKVEARTRALHDAQEQLVRREKLAVLGQMSGGIAHELRQPLAVISNAVYFLQAAQPNANPTTQEYLGLINAELQTADHIITDLLSFARARVAEKEPVAVATVVEQTLARNPAPAGIAVQVALPPDLPPVYVDPRQLGQVLNNLIANAYQAMPRGGQLALTAAPAATGFVSLAVADTGDGIAPENLPKLFEPLFTTKTKGIGLGLTITKMLVEANGGAIEVMSQAGKGSTFTLCLPMIEAAAEPESGDAASAIRH